MKVVFSEVGEKLPIKPDLASLFDVLSKDDPWFWVVHPSDIYSFWDCEEDRDIATCINRGGGLLFISGSVRCGLSEQEALKYEEKGNGRIHFLRTPCSKSNSNSAKRIMSFLDIVEHLQGGDPFSWELLIPEPWPENLVALYLLLKAIEILPERKTIIINAWGEMEEGWRSGVLKGAIEEFKEGTRQENTTFEKVLVSALDDSSKDFLLNMDVAETVSTLNGCISKRNELD